MPKTRGEVINEVVKASEALNSIINELINSNPEIIQMTLEHQSKRLPSGKLIPQNIQLKVVF